MADMNIDTVDTDIVKQGYVFLKRPPGSKHSLRLRAWQRKYVVLRDVSMENGISTFELYDTEKSFREKHQPAYSLDLKYVVHVKPYKLSKRFAYSLIIERGLNSGLVLGFDSYFDMQSWEQALNRLSEKRQLIYKYKDFNVVSTKVSARDNDRRPSCPGRINHSTGSISNSAEIPPFFAAAPPHMLRGWSDSVDSLPEPLRSTGPPTTPRVGSTLSVFPNNDAFSNDFISAKCNGLLVHLQQTQDAMRHGLCGDYYMNIMCDGITLTNVTSLKEIIAWPMMSIRRLKSDMNVSKYQTLTLEASNMCGEAKGTYVFKTSHGSELISKARQISKQPSGNARTCRQRLNFDSFPTAPALRKLSSPNPKQGAADGYLDLVESPCRAARILDEHADSGFDDSDEEHRMNASPGLDSFIPPADLRDIF